MGLRHGTEPRAVLHVSAQPRVEWNVGGPREDLQVDYLRINPLPDALSALRQVAGWITDYNETRPHSALRIRSPRESIRAQAQWAADL
jgi:transposase InsO family protein